ncbi:MAG: pyrroline-5-carboxylate reductase [Gammaproteobacteria bacterium]
MNTKKIGFIGGGNMATSLISGLIASGHPSAGIHVSDIDADKLRALESTLNVNTTQNNDEIIAHSDVVVYSVKPQALGEIARNTAQAVHLKKPLVVSIAAGISQQSLAKWLGADCAIVRCMPNTPALVQTGATALHANANVSEAQKDLAENILRSVGLAMWVETEDLMDAVTAVSGSGPAYFFLLMEAMEKTALELGLEKHTARLLIQQTALGAAKIALESAESPEQLRIRVTSPGGTTQRALEVFEEGRFSQLVSDALHAARNRSIEMSKQLGEN